MMAEMQGRITGTNNDTNTGVLQGIIIESQHGDIRIYKPDAWTDQEAFEAAIGKRVTVRVVVTVEP